jgi:hypothetical protein
MKSRSKHPKPKPKREASPPDLTGGRKRDTRFQRGQSANPDAQFKPGVSGNPAGRPLGARSRLSEAFVAAVAAEFDRRGTDCLRQLDAHDFVQVALALVPKKVDATIEETKALYVMHDGSLSAEEWSACYCDPSDHLKNYPDSKLRPGMNPRELKGIKVQPPSKPRH